MPTDAVLYSIVQGNTILIDGITEIMIDAVAGDSVALSSRTATSIKQVRYCTMDRPWQSSN